MKPRLSSTTSWGSDSEGAGSLGRGSQIYFSSKARLSFRHQLDSNINAVDATDWAEKLNGRFSSLWWWKGISAACLSELIINQVQQGRKTGWKVTLNRGGSALTACWEDREQKSCLHCSPPISALFVLLSFFNPEFHLRHDHEELIRSWTIKTNLY